MKELYERNAVTMDINPWAIELRFEIMVWQLEDEKKKDTDQYDFGYMIIIISNTKSIGTGLNIPQIRFTQPSLMEVLEVWVVMVNMYLIKHFTFQTTWRLWSRSHLDVVEDVWEAVHSKSQILE